MAEGYDIHIFVTFNMSGCTTDVRQTMSISVWIPTVSTETGNQILQWMTSKYVFIPLFHLFTFKLIQNGWKTYWIYIQQV